MGSGLMGGPAPAHLQLRAADVQAALTILARGTIRPEGNEPLSLLCVDLRRANLSNARLAGVDLEGTNLSWAWLPHAQLDGADLTNANLYRPILSIRALRELNWCKPACAERVWRAHRWWRRISMEPASTGNC